MANSKKRLGRGLGGLISGASTSVTNKATPTQKVEKKEKAANAISSDVASPTNYFEVAIKDLKTNPYQPRREIDSERVEELAASIQSEGLLQPIVVRASEGHYELIAGERRLRAFKFLKRKKIPARIIDANDASSATLALIENLQRENLNPIDEALGYASLIKDFDLTQEAVAQRVGKGRASVANALRLLALGTEIQGYLSRRLISTGHAKVLLGLDEEEQRNLLARRIIESGMSVREAEQQVRSLKRLPTSPEKKKAKAPEKEQAVIRQLEKRVGEHFNTRCSIKHGSKKGTLMIEYFGNEDLDRILDKLGVPNCS